MAKGKRSRKEKHAVVVSDTGYLEQRIASAIGSYSFPQARLVVLGKGEDSYKLNDTLGRKALVEAVPYGVFGSYGDDESFTVVSTTVLEKLLELVIQLNASVTTTKSAFLPKKDVKKALMAEEKAHQEYEARREI